MNIPEATKEFTTPSGEHKILVRAYLTGEDRRANRKFILNISEQGQGMNVEAIDKAEDFQVTQIVLELDGDKENIVERVLKLRAVDYDFVIDTVKQVTEGLDDKKKVISDSSTKTSSTDEK